MNKAYFKDKGDLTLPIIVCVECIETKIIKEIEVDISGLGSRSNQPSDRVLADYGLTRDQYNTNTKVYEEWFMDFIPIKEILKNTRYEDQFSYIVALKLINEINAI